VAKVEFIPGVAKSFLSHGSLELTNRVTSAVEADYFHTTINQYDMIREQQQDLFCSFSLHTSPLPKMWFSRILNAIFHCFYVAVIKGTKIVKRSNTGNLSKTTTNLYRHHCMCLYFSIEGT
jgi:hypothetical protein